MSLTLAEIVEATGGRLLQGELSDDRLAVSTDTRTLRKGEMFLALKGPRFDGHEFVARALNDASGVIVSEPPVSPPRGKAVVLVRDTLPALHAMARHARRRLGVPVVAVTGTNGKTTTKEMVVSALGGRLSVLSNPGNLNNHVGLPMSLLRPSEGVEIVVLEMGASAPGDIERLCRIAEPDCGVLTNIGEGHLEGFGGLEGVRRAKLELLVHVGVAVANADDEFLMAGMAGYKGRVVRYGLGPGNDVSATDIEDSGHGAAFTLRMGGMSARVGLSVSGRFNVSNALAAAAVADNYGLSIEEIAEGLQGFRGVPMRLDVREVEGRRIVLDAYNSNPSSLAAALGELKGLSGGGAMVCVLGDMLELGRYSAEAHRDVGRRLQGMGVRLLIAVGPEMALAAGEFEAMGGRAVCYGSARDAAPALMGLTSAGDTVFVKGSRGMRMEEVLADVV